MNYDKRNFETSLHNVLQDRIMSRTDVAEWENSKSGILQLSDKI